MPGLVRHQLTGGKCTAGAVITTAPATGVNAGGGGIPPPAGLEIFNFLC